MEYLVQPKYFGYYRSPIYAEWSPKRMTTYYELELYTTGCGTSRIDGAEMPHAPGNLLFVRPGQLRQSLGQFACYAVHFSCLDAYLAKAYLAPLPICFQAYDAARLAHLFEAVTEAVLSESDGEHLLSCAKLLELIATIRTSARLGCGARPYQQHAPAVFDACRYMDLQFSKPIKLFDIARAARLSPSYFHTVFKAVMQETPSAYLLQRRLLEAKKRLLSGMMGIAEIAEQTGFLNQAYFTHVFKKSVGMTPREFRNANALENQLQK